MGLLRTAVEQREAWRLESAVLPDQLTQPQAERLQSWYVSESREVEVVAAAALPIGAVVWELQRMVQVEARARCAMVAPQIPQQKQ